MKNILTPNQKAHRICNSLKIEDRLSCFGVHKIKSFLGGNPGNQQRFTLMYITRSKAAVRAFEPGPGKHRMSNHWQHCLVLITATFSSLESWLCMSG